MSEIDWADFVHVKYPWRSTVRLGVVVDIRRPLRLGQDVSCRVRCLLAKPGVIIEQTLPLRALSRVPAYQELSQARRVWLHWYVPHLGRVAGLSEHRIAERVGLLPDVVGYILRTAPAEAGVP